MSYPRGPQRDASPRIFPASPPPRSMPLTPSGTRGESGPLPHSPEQRRSLLLPPAITPALAMPSGAAPQATASTSSQLASNRYPATMIVFFLAFLGYLLYENSQGDNLPNLTRTISDVFVFVGSGICTVVCFQAAYKLRIAHVTEAAIMAGRSSLGWALLGCAALVYTIGQIIWTGFELNYAVVPFPSFYDPFYLAVYPLSWVGIALLVPRLGSAAGRARLLIDSAIVVACALALFWYFILGPTIASLGGSAILKFVSLAYPIGDLSLVVASAFLLFGPSGTSVLARPLSRLTIGVTWLAFTDALYGYNQLQGTYHTGLLQDIGWPMSWLFIGAAALIYPSSLAIATTDYLPSTLPGRLARWKNYITGLRATTPMVLTLVTCALLGFAVVSRNVAPLSQIIIVCVGLFILPIVRQLLTLIDNILLTERLRIALGQSNLAFEQSQQALLRTTQRAQQYDELRAGIEDIQTVHALLAKGDMHARAKVDGPLTPIAQSLNLLIERLQRWTHFEQANTVMEDEAATLREALEKLSAGQVASFPATRSTLPTGAALVAALRHQRGLVARFARLREGIGTIGPRWKAAREAAHLAQKRLTPGATAEDIIAAREALFQVEQKLDSNMTLLQDIWLQLKQYEQNTGHLEFSPPPR